MRAVREIMLWSLVGDSDDKRFWALVELAVHLCDVKFTTMEYSSLFFTPAAMCSNKESAASI